ncbi:MULTISPECIES: PspA/IM30 family protein [Planktothricoides]|uniref:PspA/IM30 family protein n=2 Tax=Planktothricoides raciborskii TaxID=132608 RepID=A0AAU8JJ32_9CYAN|nr:MULTISPECIES: PspA/IM30 family protein [Planktothricoides]KOR38065.1 phage-shock protein [Planktothricoides sp. SR001]MBD2542504.1 PspA/IM30 family protein [Planktothricoides raciborskii FACHB-1370]MBD2580961.1 PspA/IM30 family protein [Planktothricoides raciborskii FACHB-1261]
MGLFERIMRVIRSQINSLVSKAEDPEKILEQAVMDMQTDLIQVRQAVAQAIATQKRTERQYEQAKSTADEWYKRAQLALQKGDEHLAKEALTRRQSYQQTANSLKGQIDSQQEIVAQLKNNMRGLESKIAEAKTKKDLYIARARSAQASEKLSEMLGSLNTSSAMSAFERMEEKVMQLEARSEAIASLGSDDLEKQFSALESNNIDNELAAMKQQMLESKQPKGTLPGSNNSGANSGQ